MGSVPFTRAIYFSKGYLSANQCPFDCMSKCCLDAHLLTLVRGSESNTYCLVTYGDLPRLLRQHLMSSCEWTLNLSLLHTKAGTCFRGKGYASGANFQGSSRRTH